MNDEKNVSRKESFEGVELWNSGEVASTAAAETAKALVQARFLVAMHKKRDIDDVRVELKRACERPRFAEAARFRKPQFGAKACPLGLRFNCPHIQRGGQYGPQCHFVCGPSIRYADESIKIMGNAEVRQDVVYEDGDQRIVQVSVTDLQTNLTKCQTISIKKRIERNKVRKGQEVVGQRENTKGETVFIIKASDDELMMKEANISAKVRRNLELQLLPQDIVEECMDAVVGTSMSETAKDPDEARKAVCDSFVGLGIKPSELAKFLGHSVESCSPFEIQSLREVFLSIRNGDSSWQDYVADKPDSPDHGSVDIDDVTPGKAEDHKDVKEPITKKKAKAEPATKKAISTAHFVAASGDVERHRAKLEAAGFEIKTDKDTGEVLAFTPGMSLLKARQAATVAKGLGLSFDSQEEEVE